MLSELDCGAAQSYATLAHSTLQVAELRELPHSADAFLAKVNTAPGGSR